MSSEDRRVNKTTNLPARKELKKAVEAVHSSSRLGFLALKLLNVLVHNALKDIESSKETYRITIANASSGCGFRSNDTKVLKSAARELQREQIEWDVTGQNPIWGVTSFLSEVIIRDGVIEYSMPPTVRKLFSLKEGRSWALLNLEFQTQFTSVFALKLYENTVRYKGTGSTGTKSISEWRKLLQAYAEVYNEFKYFKRDVIEKALKEVNELTDLIITANYIKEGRSVVAICFYIEPKPLPPEADGANLNQDLLRRIEALGVTERTAKKYLFEYEQGYLEGNVAVVEERYRAGIIKTNPAAYLKRALEQDFREIKTELERQREEERARAAALEAKRAAEVEAGRAITSKKLDDAKQRFEQLDADNQDNEIGEFSEHIRATNSYLFKNLQKSGISSPSVYKEFIKWLAHKWEQAAT